MQEIGSSPKFLIKPPKKLVSGMQPYFNPTRSFMQKIRVTPRNTKSKSQGVYILHKIQIFSPANNSEVLVTLL